MLPHAEPPARDDTGIAPRRPGPAVAKEPGPTPGISGLKARRVAAGLFIALVLVLWGAFSAYEPPVVLPSPLRVARQFLMLWSDPVFLAFAAASLWHVVASVVIAFLVGVAIALLAYFLPLLEPAVYGRLAPFLNSFSTIGWGFLALIWFGITHDAVIFATVVSLVPLAIINAGAGLRELDLEFLEMAQSFSRSAARRTYLVILPMLFPYLFATLRLCFGISWQAVLVVELVCGSGGLGYLISSARGRYATDVVFAVALLIFAVVYVTDRLIFAKIQARLRKSYAV